MLRIFLVVLLVVASLSSSFAEERRLFRLQKVRKSILEESDYEEPATTAAPEAAPVVGDATTVAPAGETSAPEGGATSAPTQAEPEPTQLHESPKADDPALGDAPKHSEYIDIAATETDLVVLAKNVEDSSNELGDVKLEVVNKQNEEADLDRQKQEIDKVIAVDNSKINDLTNHIKAVQARIDRLKKEGQLAALQKELDDYEATATQSKAIADNDASVKDALAGKIKALNDAIAPLKSAEQDALKGSIGLGAGTSGAITNVPGAVATTAAPAPAF